MPRSKPYNSKKTAEETLRRFFAGSPDSDRLSVGEIFQITGRKGKDSRANMAWLSNKLTILRSHDLIEAEYSYEGKRRLQGVRLSLDGIRALGRAVPDGSSTPRAGAPSIDDALAIVSGLRRQYPEFDIALTVKPKERA